MDMKEGYQKVSDRLLSQWNQNTVDSRYLDLPYLK